MEEGNWLQDYSNGSWDEEKIYKCHIHRDNRIIHWVIHWVNLRNRPVLDLWWKKMKNLIEMRNLLRNLFDRSIEVKLACRLIWVFIWICCWQMKVIQKNAYYFFHEERRMNVRLFFLNFPCTDSCIDRTRRKKNPVYLFTLFFASDEITCWITWRCYVFLSRKIDHQTGRKATLLGKIQRKNNISAEILEVAQEALPFLSVVLSVVNHP